jgi:adenine deaminase
MTRPPTVTFITGFCLIQGAIASSVGHDSSNILTVEKNDADLIRAINSFISSKGGVGASLGEKHILQNLPLLVGGITTHADAHDTAQAYETIVTFVKDEPNVSDGAPYMLLSFIALLMIS